MNITTTCNTCHDTGWDDAFSSPCGDCGADLATSEQIEQARTDHQTAQEQIHERYTEARKLIDWLEAQTGNDFATSIAKQFHQKGSLTEKQWAAAHRMWDRHKQQQADAAAGVAIYRWTKHEGEWALVGPPADFGAEVTVRKANGEEQTQTVGAELDCLGDFSRVYRVGVKKQTAAAGVEISDGFWFEQQDESVVIYKVQRSQTGNLYAKQLVGDPGETMSWEYVGSAPVRSGRLQQLDLETAKRFGQLYGACCVCGRTLTNEGSIEAGIGPVCATKL